MKKTILVSIVILVVLSAIVIFAEYKWYLGEYLLMLMGLFAVGSLPGVLLALITLIPAVRKRAQSDLAGRVVTLLAVMILSVVLMFFVTKRLGVKVHYIFTFIPRMGLEEDYEYSSGKFYAFWTKYEKKSWAIEHETWIRLMVPPLLREPCYTIDKDVCEFVDQLPENRELLSQDYARWFAQGFALAIALNLPGGALAWHLTHKKRSQEMVTED